MRERNLSDEALDAMELALRLASNPAAAARRKAFQERVRRDAEMIAHLGADELVAALKAFNPAYIDDLLRQKSIEDLRERVVMNMQGAKGRQRMLGILGIQEGPDQGPPVP